MISLHHLENSRSQRIAWLLEKLGIACEIRRYRRDAKTSLAPARSRPRPAYRRALEKGGEFAILG